MTAVNCPGDGVPAGHTPRVVTYRGGARWTFGPSAPPAGHRTMGPDTTTIGYGDAAPSGLPPSGTEGDGPVRVLIVFESMYGNTREIAEEIGAGMEGDDVTVAAVHDVDRGLVEAADLVVVGAPTHVHGLPRPTSRRGAVDAAAKTDDLTLEPHATETGVREWLDGLPKHAHSPAAAFDTRIDVAPLLSGRASRAIDRQLRHHGYRPVAEPESFLVDKQSRLIDGELQRARKWGGRVQAAARALSPAGT